MSFFPCFVNRDPVCFLLLDTDTQSVQAPKRLTTAVCPREGKESTIGNYAKKISPLICVSV